MRKILLVAFIVTSAAGAQAATVTVGPSDCSAATVNSAISATSTHDGDTVLLTCTGSITWTATVAIPSTKGIALEVQGGSNTPKTSANFPLIVTSNQSPAIIATISPGNTVVRISGFRFAPNTGSADPFLEITGAGNGPSNLGAFRIDNNYFDTISAVENVAIWPGRSGSTGQLWGLIDDNTFHNVYRASDTSYGPYNIQVWNYWYPPGYGYCFGCNGWTDGDFAYGSEHEVFIEDNLFEQTASAAGHMRHYISAELGARYVSRYNTFNNNYPDENADLHDAHGLCLVDSNGAGSRGGEIYNNTVTGTGYDRAMVLRGGSWLIYNNTIQVGGGGAIEFDEYRAETTGECAAAAALGGLMPPWPVPSGASWSASAPWINQVTDASYYQLPQQVFNTFAWNNKTNTGSTIQPSVDPGYPVVALYIQNGRDYFANSNGSEPSGISSYVPYTYPDPLRGGGSSPQPPSAASGLAASAN